MQKITSLLLALLLVVAGYAQGETPFFSEDFEGDTHKFTLVNGGQVNQWHVGAATAAAGSSKAAYISNDDGAANSYSINSTSVVHMYADVEFPAAENSRYQLSFDWKGLGESCCDFLWVYVVDASVTPEVGSFLGPGEPLGAYGGLSDWRQDEILLPQAYGGTTKRIVFTWKNDNSVGAQPPAAVDNVSLTMQLEQTAESGTTGPLTWELSSFGTLTISGSGPMPDYSEGAAPWYAHSSSISSVVVKEGVTSISNHAFSDCYNLSSVSLPEGLESIGTSAFYSCYSLSSVSLPESITAIGDNAFAACWGLTVVLNPKPVPIAIPENAFEGISSSCVLQVPADKMADYKAAEVWGGSFAKIFPIGLSPWTWECGAEGSSLFASPSLDPNSWQPFTLTISGTGSMADYGVNEAPWAYYYNYITDVVVEDGVTSVGANAFREFYQLSSLTLGSDVESIGSQAFAWCGSLAMLTNHNPTPVSISANTFTGFNRCILQVPPGAVDAYKAAPVWGSAFTRIMAIGEDPYSWSCGANGSNLTARLSSDTLYVSGTGAMANYSFDPKNGRGTAPWNDGYDAIRVVVVGEGVTSVGDYFLYGCNELYSLSLGNSVQRIGKSAFENCQTLNTLSIPNSVDTVDRNAFYRCYGLNTLSVGSGVETIAYGAFEGCPLANLSFAAGSKLKTIGDYAFYNAGFKSIALPEGLETIGRLAFYGTALQQLSLPESLTAIGAAAFAYSVQLRSVESFGGVKTIGSNAFRDCLVLNSVTLNKELTHLGLSVFSGCDSLAAIHVEAGNATYSSVDGVLHKGKALVLCPPAKTGDYAIGSGVELVDSMAFYGCSGVSSVIFSPSVTEIRYGAFAGCGGLISVNLGSGLTLIGDAAFAGCTALRAINVDGGNSAYASQDGVLFNKAKTTLLQYPAGKADKGYSIPAGVKTVAAYAFMGNAALGAVNFPTGLETIGLGAFSGVGISAALLPAGLKTIGVGAFDNCYSLSSVSLPAGLETIGDQAFYNCHSLTALAIPEGMKSIGARAFAYCSSLDELSLPAGLKTIGHAAFESCSQLRSLSLPTGLDTIFDYAFYSCPLSELSLPEGLKVIGIYAFYGNRLSSISLPASLTAVGSYAFYNGGFSGSLELITSLNPQPPMAGEEFTFTWSGGSILLEVPAGSVEAYRAAPFWKYFPNIVAIGSPRMWNCGYSEVWGECTNAVVATLSRDTLYVNGTGRMANFSTIPWNKLRDSIRAVVVGSGVTGIGNEAFSRHDSLRSVVLGDDVEEIGSYAFYFCRNLSFLSFGSGLTYLHSGAFYGCTKLDSVRLPASLSYLSADAFDGCTNLTAINVEEGGVDYFSIDGVLFYGTTLVRYPEGKAGAYLVPPIAIAIDYRAFYHCAKLTSVTLHAGLSINADGTFMGCSTLTEVVNLKPVPQPINSYTFYGVNTAACKLRVLESSVDAYRAAYVWQNFAIEALVFCNVSFEVNGAAAPIDTIKALIAGNKIAQPATPTKEGYTFGGWYRDAGFTQVWSFGADVVTESLTLHAKWIDNSTPTYTLSFSTDGGTEYAPLLVEANAKITAPSSAPLKEGFVFGGWYRDAGCNTAWLFDTDRVTAATTLYAKWTVATFTVAFNAKGGSAVDSLKNVPYNSTIAAPASPTRYGYWCYGWYSGDPDMGGSVYWDFSSSRVKANMTLYAYWGKRNYSVNLNRYGGSTSDWYTNVVHGDTVPTPDSTWTTREGHTFVGWYKDADCDTAWAFATDTVTEFTILYAKWTVNSYTVTLNTQGGSTLSPIVASYGSTIAEPAANPSKADSAFVGWYREAAGINRWNFATDVLTSDTVLYAKWVGAEVPTYTLTFNSMGGDSVPSVTKILSGSKVAEPAAPTKEGNTFDGWYKDVGCTMGWNFAINTVASDTMLYAKWVPTRYTVQFNSASGSAVQAYIGVQHGTGIAAPTPPTRSGYAFGGWYREPWGWGGNSWDFNADVVIENTTLYARWLNLYTVAFNSMGGTVVDSVKSVPEGTTIAAPTPSPTKAGFTFAGWYMDEECTGAWAFGTDEVWYDRTLYAKWIDNSIPTYTVTFDSKSGSAVPSATGILSGGKVSKPNDPTRAGHLFGGWYQDEAYTLAWNFDTAAVRLSLTLYAKWTAVYTVSFNANGGSAVAPIEGVISGSRIVEPAMPGRDGYAFGGWYQDAGCNDDWVFASDVVTANMTLYAKWTAVYTVTFNPVGGSAVPAVEGVLHGTTIAAPANPSRPGYNFNAWYKDAGYTNVWTFGTDVVVANMTLYARWIDTSVTTYTVTYNTQGGTNVPPATGVQSGEKLNQPANPTREGYLFSGWYKDEACTAPWNFDTDVVAASLTLYAKWTVVYTVSFNAKGGSAVASIEGVAWGSTIAEPAAPLRSGYTFNGWHKDTACTKVWVFATDRVTSDTTLYAKWVGTSTAVAVTGVSLSKAAVTLTVDSSLQLTANLAPANATNQSVAWSSTNTTVATVSGTGGTVTVIAHAVGVANIIVTTADGGFKDTCTVTVTLGGTINPPNAVAARELLPLKFYPNPVSNGRVTLDLQDAGWQAAGRALQVEVYSLNGALVATYSIAGAQTSINISHLPSGTYVVRVGKYVGKLVKQ